MEPLRILYLMQGIPGSGKSTVAEMIQKTHVDLQIRTRYRSTDLLWYRNGVYEYDSEKLADKHRQNMQLVVEDMQENIPVIIVDNTNIMRWQATPYFTLAKIFDYEVQVVSVQVPVELAIARQANRPLDRQVPEDKIREMHDALESLV